MSAVACCRVVVRADGDVDRHAAGLPWIRFERRGGAVYAECAADAVEGARSALARAGLELEVAGAFSRPRSLVPAVVPHLAPLRDGDVVDVVAVRGSSLGEATAWVRRRRRWPRLRPDAIASERVRALLRGEDLVFRWRRLVFAAPAVLRSRALEGARPVVFDREALDGDLDRVAFASAGALGAWLRV